MGYEVASVAVRPAMLAALLLLSPWSLLGLDVTLAWDPSTDASVSGYRIYYGMASHAYTEVVDTGTANTLTISGLIQNATYYFAATAYNPAGLESAFSAEVWVGQPGLRRTASRGDLDFDGDGRADLAAWDPATGTWFIRLAGDYFGSGFMSGPTYSVGWGWAAARPMRGDFDGDGKSDAVVYDPAGGDWYIKFSGGSSAKVHWGWWASVPLTGDFNGDGRSDLAAFDPGTGIWYIKCSGPDRLSFGSGASYAVAWGPTNSTPLCGDFDGDGKADLVTYERSSGNWHILFSSGGAKSVHWGWPAARLAPGDFNGDGRTDLGVYDSSTGIWYVKYSGASYASFEYGTSTAISFGSPGAIPMPADYDDDGITDLAVYEPSTGDWQIRFSRGGSVKVHWGWAAARVP